MKTRYSFLGAITLTIGVASVVVAQESAAPATAKAPVWHVSPGQSTYYINSVAVSGDGSRTVGGTFYHSYGATGRAETQTETASDGETGVFGTYCYDRKGNLLWKDEFDGWQGVYWVDICRDGKYAASGGWFSQTPAYSGFVRAFDASSGRRLLDYRTAKRVNQVVLSAQGAWLVSAAENLVLFHLKDGAYQKCDTYTPPAMSGGSNYLVSAGMSGDGKVIVCSDYAGNITLLSAADGKLRQRQQWSLPAGSYSHMVRLTSDGKTFAAGGPSGTFYLFDTAQFISSGQPTITYQTGSTGSVYSVAVADDGSAFVGVVNYQSTQGMVYYVARSGSQGTLQWQYQTAHNPNCAWLNLAHDMLAVADGHPDGTPGGYYLLSAASGTLRWQYPTSNMSWPIMISANGSAVVAGSDDSNIYYFKP